MEGLRMKLLTSKPRSFFYTLLIYVFIMFEMGVLSSFRFVAIGGAADKYGNGLSVKGVSDFAGVTEKVGWNFIVFSLLILLATLIFAFALGYNRNPAGLAGLVLINLGPSVLGIFYNFDFFAGYGSSHFMPAMSAVGLTFCRTFAQQKTNVLTGCGAIAAAIVICWLIGLLVRKRHADKYEITL
jgi:hypothetical protein